MKILSQTEGGDVAIPYTCMGYRCFVVANFVYMDCVVFFLRISLDTDCNSYYIY